MVRKDLKVLIEVSLLVGLALLLSVFRLFRMPQGGSVSLEMLPLLILAFRRGSKIGILGGTLFGFLKLILGPSIIHPIQVIFDYPLPFAVLGVAGFALFRQRISLGIIVAGFLRYLTHVFAGAVFWGQYAPEGTPALLYSLSYNAPYMIMETLIVLVLIRLLATREGILDEKNTPSA